VTLGADRESFHEGKACQTAARAGWDNIKVLKRGWPDRLFWKNRAYLWVEFKAPGKPLRPQQGYRARQLERQGERVLRIDDWAALLPALEKIEREERIGLDRGGAAG